MSEINYVLYPKSRKSHKCTQCGLEIPRGVEYAHHKGLYDGEFFSNKMHKECLEEWTDLNSDAYCDEDWLWLADFNHTGGFNFTNHKYTIKEIYGLDAKE